MKNILKIKSVLSGFGILAFFILCGSLTQVSAQKRYVVEQAQQAVRDKIEREKGGYVTFPNSNWTETYFISNTQTGVRGEGVWTKDSKTRDFSYEARVSNNGNVDKISYKFTSDNNSGGNVPSWAIGTFYGRNPQTGGNITLSIQSNGDVVITFENGSNNYASIRGDRLNNGGIISRVTKINNGIRTTRLDNGEAIDYYANGNNNNNNGGGNVPSWAIGTFYARNPQTGGNITMSINSNGSVVITFENGATNYASIRGDRLTNNGVVSRVTRIRNGIRTTRLDNGEAIDYYANGNNNNNNGGGNVPSWAIGRFYGRNPQTGGTITLDINRDGSVVITFENGATNYAKIDGDRLTNNGVVSRVTKINNGIRTTRLDNGERIDYRR